MSTPQHKFLVAPLTDSEAVSRSATLGKRRQQFSCASENRHIAGNTFVCDMSGQLIFVTDKSAGGKSSLRHAHQNANFNSEQILKTYGVLVLLYCVRQSQIVRSSFYLVDGTPVKISCVSFSLSFCGMLSEVERSIHQWSCVLVIMLRCTVPHLFGMLVNYVLVTILNIWCLQKCVLSFSQKNECYVMLHCGKYTF